MPNWRQNLLFAGVGLAAVVALFLWLRSDGDGERGGDGDPDNDQQVTGDTSNGDPQQRQNFFDRLKWESNMIPVDENGDPILIKVSGLVYDIVTDDPVEGVDVVFRARGNDATAYSGPGGEYSVDISPGSYQVYAISENRYGLQERRLNLTRNGREFRHDIGMVALAHIEGSVVDGKGRPVADAEVTFDTWLGRGRYRTRNLERYTAAQSRAVSDASGAFAIDVVPGKVTLLAEIDGMKGHLELPDVVPGDTREATIVLDRSIGVSGVVVASTGRAVGGAAVTAATTYKGTNVRNVKSTTSADDGTFSVDGLTVGVLKVEARAEGYGPSTYFDKDVTTDEHLQVKLTLSEPLRLSGTVIDDVGRGLSGVTVSAIRRSSRMEAIATETESDGSFEFLELSSDPYDLKAEGGGYEPTYSRGVTPPASDLEIRLGAPTSIRGIVTTTEGEPVTSFTATVIQQTIAGASRAGYPVPTRFQNKDGEFVLNVRDAGTYLVLVAAPGYAGSGPVEVVVPPGGAGNGTFILGRGGRVEGVVRSVSGEPVARAQVSLLAGQRGHGAYTDSSGRFELDDVTPGLRSIHAAHQSFVDGSVSGVEVTAGGVSKVEIELSPASGEDNEIELVGIGAVIDLHGENVRVRSTLSSGPAVRAGVRRRDSIVSIDGVSTHGMWLSEVAERLRGRSGTTVKLELKRGSELLRISVTRERLRGEIPKRGLVAGGNTRSKPRLRADRGTTSMLG